MCGPSFQLSRLAVSVYTIVRVNTGSGVNTQNVQWTALVCFPLASDGLIFSAIDTITRTVVSPNSISYNHLTLSRQSR